MSDSAPTTPADSLGGELRRAVAGLPSNARFVLVDGRDVPPGLSCHAKAVVKGDARSLSIAAASIAVTVAARRSAVVDPVEAAR